MTCESTRRGGQCAGEEYDARDKKTNGRDGKYAKNYRRGRRASWGTGIGRIIGGREIEGQMRDKNIFNGSGDNGKIGRQRRGEGGGYNGVWLIRQQGRSGDAFRHLCTSDVE